MAEFGLIAGVVSVAGAAVASSKALFEMVDEVRNASLEIITISKDTHAFHAVVTSVLMAVRNTTVVAILQQDPELCEAVVNLADPLQNCAGILKRIQGMLKPHLKPSNDGGHRISSTDIRWMFSKRKEVMNCRTRLESTKSTLDVALASINFLCSLRSAGKNAVPISSFGTNIQDPDVDAGSVLLEYADYSSRTSCGTLDISPNPSPQMRSTSSRYNSGSDDENPIVPKPRKASSRPHQNPPSNFHINRFLRHSHSIPDLSPLPTPQTKSTRYRYNSDSEDETRDLSSLPTPETQSKRYRYNWYSEDEITILPEPEE